MEQSASPGPLISHLLTHNNQYLQCIAKKNAIDPAAATAVTNCPYLIMLLSFLHLRLVEQSSPLSVGESYAFIGMIQTIPFLFLITKQQQILFYAKRWKPSFNYSLNLFFFNCVQSLDRCSS